MEEDFGACLQSSSDIFWCPCGALQGTAAQVERQLPGNPSWSQAFLFPLTPKQRDYLIPNKWSMPLCSVWG